VIAASVFVWKPGLLTLALTWIVTIALGVFAWARLRPADLGLSLRGLGLSIIYAIGWLGLTEFALLILAFAKGLPAQRPAVSGNIGPLADQLLVFALSEEIVVRGFLLAQLYRKLRKPCGSVRVAALVAVLISLCFFVLLHIPHRMYEHVSSADLAINLTLTGTFGLLFCLVYLRTGNLLVAVVVHAVSNVQSLLPSPLSWRVKNLCLAIAALLAAEIYARWIDSCRPHNSAREFGISS
jgi:membrane protease YdiL (CAAX protease family)